MGAKASLQKHLLHQQHSPEQNSCSSSSRISSRSDHQINLVGNDISRFTNVEISNFYRHHHFTSSSRDQKSDQQVKVLESCSTEKIERRKKPSASQNTQKKQLGVRKSRSTDNMLYTTTLITVEQLLNNHAKQRQQRNPSPTSFISEQLFPSENIEKSLSTTCLNQTFPSKITRKKISPSLKLVLIEPQEFQNIDEIGKGHFGIVYHALYKGKRDVALKTLYIEDEYSSNYLFNSYDENIYELLYEAYIMTRLKHPNLLRIIGVTFFGDKQQLCLVTDFMKNGSLLNYLRKNREIFFQSDFQYINNKLNKFGKQIFDAMLYLEERNIIHRDLAARNCLIGQDDKLKVGDFGLTKLTDHGLYKGTARSVCAPRWTSPEALFSSKYSSRSDVWSYGITLWEIYSLGERPFRNVNNSAVQILLKNSSENLTHFLPQPEHFGSTEIYTNIILPCLTYNVAMRPRFRDLRERLLTLLTDKD
ncbi:unnamed protein product [Rotaria sordida]|uniref:Protein kinase domain-containing protein n=1 Tax=Rotaria sordida TaxID=392033 RepID=A0A814EYD3_9BILA|nr:unnamed protein product [Rotaria sordida]